MVRGGQLARLTGQAARHHDLVLKVLDPDPSCPAAATGCEIVLGDPGEMDDLRRFAAVSDILCFDDESVPLEHLRALEADGVVLAPPADAAELAFDKSVARRRLGEMGLPVPRWADAVGVDELVAAGDSIGWPVVAKAPRRGYDGRGVAVVQSAEDAGSVVAALGADLVVEEMVDFDLEVAVTVARRPGGQAVAFPPVRTVQEDGICRQVGFPSGLDDDVARAAADLALRLADAAGVIGLMTVELFVVGDTLLINELALRPHNSAHLTIDAFDVSQFDLLLLAAADRELPTPKAVVGAAVMANVLGGDSPPPPPGEPSPGVHVHDYGKTSRPGRKIGHVTVVAPDLAEALDRLRRFEADSGIDTGSGVGVAP